MSTTRSSPSSFTKQIAFNVIPHIDVFMDDGSTKEEWKMAVETRKILDPDIAVTATCVRVPVFIGHAEAVNVEFERPLGEDEARAALRDAPGVIVVDHRADGGYVTPAEAAGEDAVYVSRIRRDPTVPNGLNLWVVADNLRKGAALNAVQIAEILVDRLSRRPARPRRSNVEPLRRRAAQSHGQGLPRPSVVTSVSSPSRRQRLGQGPAMPRHAGSHR